MPSLRSTDYINTIPPEREPWFPGDEHVERRIRAYIRWNAAIMVHRAQRPGRRASAATSRRTPRRPASTRSASTTSSAARTTPAAATRSTIQGHASPGMYARAFLEGRLAEDQLDGFRQELSHPGGGLPSLPAPAADAGLLGVPDRLHGPRPDQRDLPGAVQPLPAQPRHQGHQPAARVGVPRRRRDGRARVARRDRPGGPRGARQPHLRHQLQPAAARRAGARQRQGHPGAGVVLPRRRLERHQGRSGVASGTRCSPRTPTARWST